MHTRRHRDATQKKMEPGPILLHHALLVACSVNSPVATIGFACPNLLRFLHRVWCAWGLMPLRVVSSGPRSWLKPALYIRLSLPPTHLASVFSPVETKPSCLLQALQTHHFSVYFFRWFWQTGIAGTVSGHHSENMRRGEWWQRDTGVLRR